ncbi:nucleotidyltransferase family protein [Paenibacillus sp. sptzw28]|uniref:nucleotidyltransferase domain-containing protein n=1 Tax=Paenibacillus sp. sptzw28 TaxID=715179 RepID=UPI001C6F448D|nr:nucleotidyltransferase family protein [Paenibacillus sp. sptzw28]QYR20611.1 nucleotidyltransferase family protein [Paenibacillus sp. sptzw28]
MDNRFCLDLSSFSKELKLLVSLIGMKDAPEVPDHIKNYLTEEDMDWNQFVQLARHHRVYPTVYSKLSKFGNDLIPAEVVRALYMDYNKNTFQMMHITAEMDKICKQFDEHNIRSLMLKGPVLAQALYGDISLRTSKDLDILIPVDDVDRAEKILLSSGYTITDERPRILDDWKVKKHHISYYNPQTKVQIEVHWRLNPETGKEPAFEELWERRSTSSLTSYPVYFPGNEDLFLYLVSHGARHAWFRLRWLIDIDRMVRNKLDWGKLIPLLKEYHCSDLAGQALILASELIETPLSQEMKTLTADKRPYRLAQSSIDFIKEIMRLSPTKHYKRYLLSIKSNHQKWNYMVGLMYPSSWDAQTLPLPKQLHFLYVPLRPILWIWRRMKQQVTP